MSVARYDEEPFPYQIEAYHELERGQWVEVRQNDVQVPVGSRGVVLKKVPETGNYQVAVEVEGQAQKRIVALCPDQVRPVDAPLPEPNAAPESKWSEEKRRAQSEKLKAAWARKKAAKEDPAAAAAAIDAELAEAGAKLAEQAAQIIGAPRRKLTERPAPEVPDMPEPVEEPEPETELVEAIRHVQGYRDRFSEKWGSISMAEIDSMQKYVEQRGRTQSQPAPKLEPVTWTKRAADAIRPVLAEAAAAGGDVTQLALLVETISYLEDGGRP